MKRLLFCSPAIRISLIVLFSLLVSLTNTRALIAAEVQDYLSLWESTCLMNMAHPERLIALSKLEKWKEAPSGLQAFGQPDEGQLVHSWRVKNKRLSSIISLAKNTRNDQKRMVCSFIVKTKLAKRILDEMVSWYRLKLISKDSQSINQDMYFYVASFRGYKFSLGVIMGKNSVAGVMNINVIYPSL